MDARDARLLAFSAVSLLAFLTIALVAGVTDPPREWDVAVLDLVIRTFAPVRPLMVVLSFAGGALTIATWAVVLGVFYRRGVPLKSIGLIVLAPVAAEASIRVTKLLVARPRPTIDNPFPAFGTSFPSGHAANAMVLAAVLGWLAARRWPHLKPVIVAAVVVWPVMMALSRVALGVHYPSDVLAGLVLGGAWAIPVILALERTYRPIGNASASRPARP
jgi:undecaprenyl-diphosphatase